MAFAVLCAGYTSTGLSPFFSSLWNGSWCFLRFLQFNGSYLNQAELAVSDFSGNGAGILSAAGTVVSTFLVVFVAEWGDKSFFSTIGEW